MDDKKECDSFELVSKGLIAIRSAVTVVSIHVWRSPLLHIDIFNFQPRGFGVFQNSEPDFSFRGESRLFIVYPYDQSLRRIRAHLLYKQLNIIKLKSDSLLAPIEAVSVPLRDIYAESNSILINHFSQQLPRLPAREGEC